MWAGDVVIRERTSSAGVRRGVQLQIGQSDWVNSEPLRTVSGVEQELRRPPIETVDIVVLVLGKGCFGVGITIHLAEALVVAKKEGPIFPDGSTDTAAKLVLAELGLAAGSLQDVAGIKDVVAEELIRGTVKLIGAGAGNDTDDAAGGTTGFRSVVVGLYGDLVDGFDDGTDADGSDDAFVIVDTVDGVVVESIVLPVYREAGGLAAIVGAAATGQSVPWTLVGAGDNLHQLNEVAAIQREVLHCFCRHRRADGCAVGL